MSIRRKVLAILLAAALAVGTAPLTAMAGGESIQATTFWIYPQPTTLKKLKKKKTYYVRIRTYKYAPSIEENLYSTWSKPKKVKVK